MTNYPALTLFSLNVLAFKETETRFIDGTRYRSLLDLAYALTDRASYVFDADGGDNPGLLRDVERILASLDPEEMKVLVSYLIAEREFRRMNQNLSFEANIVQGFEIAKKILERNSSMRIVLDEVMSA